MVEERGELPANMKVCLFPVTAQPPTFGMIMSIMAVADKYDQIIICVEDNPVLIPTELVIKMLSLVFKFPKFYVVSHVANFEEISELPNDDLPLFNYIATMNDRIYANLTVKGYGCFLIPKAIGYDEYFHRHAFKTSQTFELMRAKTTAVPITKYIKSESSDGGEK